MAEHSNSIEERTEKERSLQTELEDAAFVNAERITEAEMHRKMLREEKERAYRAELMEKLYGAYTIESRGGWHNKRNNDLVFSVAERKITTDRNDEQTVQSMIDLAEGQGWKSLRVAGDQDFRRAVWMEASLRGIEIDGYKPREADILELEEKRKLRSHNALEQSAKDRDSKNLDAGKSAGESKAEREQEKSASGDQSKKNEHSKDDKPKELPSASKEEILHGRLVDFGVANQNFDPMGKASYYVRINTLAGEKVVWGSQFKQAIEESKAQRGDRIMLDGVGHKSIEIKERAITPSEKALESSARQLLDKHVKDPEKREQYIQGIRTELELRREQGSIPQVRIFDRTAPAKVDRETASPIVERHSERTR